MERKFDSILTQFGFNKEDFDYSPIGNGLINHTFCLTNRLSAQQFILQEINSTVFKNPEKIAKNIRLTSDYLKIHYPNYLFLEPLKSIEKQDLVVREGSFWRLLPFIKNAIAYDVVDTPEKAYEAAKTFGGLTRRLEGCDLTLFECVLDNFHDLTFRTDQFTQALKNGDPDRLSTAESLIQQLKKYNFIEEIYSEWINSEKYKLRIQHHDTKLSNVLLHEETYKGLCVIDLDTLMPGYIFSDFGDMMRTYLSPVSEEETDLEKIIVRSDYFNMITKGYLEEVGAILTTEEKKALFNAGLIMMYMQSLRFLTDYLNGDVYYKIHSPKHNYERALNQFTLLERYNDQKNNFERTINSF